MPAWEKIPAINSLLREINTVGPDRDKRSDGTIADAAHSPASDHAPDEQSSALRDRDRDDDNEVHALDVDASGPWLIGWSLERVLDILIWRHRVGELDVLQNVIYRGSIWSRSWGWTRRVYTGADMHIEHAHVSFRYGSGPGLANPENFPGPWGIVMEYQREQEGDVDSKDVVQIATGVWTADLGKGENRKDTGLVLAEAARDSAAALAGVGRLEAQMAEVLALLKPTGTLDS